MLFSDTYVFADFPVAISTEYEFFHRISSLYRSKAVPQFVITTTQADIDSEKAFDFERTSSSREQLEILAVQRKLSEELLNHDTILFHSSALAVDGEGYLFAAVSGTGKSTHAKLWREVYGDRVTMINDDKPFLKITDNEARVYGSPWDGKHHLSTNTSVPIKAICILTRDTTNHIERITPEEAFPILYQQTYRPKEREKLLKVLDLIIRLSNRVALYRLGCNMDPEAAEVSYKGMQE